MSITRVVATPDGFASPEDLAHQDPQAQPFGPQSRVVGGTVSYTPGVGPDAQVGGVERYQSTMPDQSDSGSIAATYSATYGKPSVVVGGMRTNVEVAERWGLIHREASGRWVDSKPADQQGAAVQAKVAEEQQPQQQEGPASFFDQQTDTQIAEVIADWPQHAYDGAQARLVALLARGTGSKESIAAQLARDVPGMEAHVALQHVQNFQRAHEAALEKALTPLGLVGDRGNAFLETLRANPSKFQEAVQRLFHERSAEGFLAPAREWVRRNPSAEAAQLKAAGWDIGTDPTTGETLVKAPGGTEWVTLKQLASGSAEGKGKPQQGKQLMQSVPTGDPVMHEAFERAGFEVGDFKGQMYVRRDGRGQWLRAADVLNNAR